MLQVAKRSNQYKRNAPSLEILKSLLQNISKKYFPVLTKLVGIYTTIISQKGQSTSDKALRKCEKLIQITRYFLISEWQDSNGMCFRLFNLTCAYEFILRASNFSHKHKFHCN